MAGAAWILCASGDLARRLAARHPGAAGKTRVAAGPDDPALREVHRALALPTTAFEV